MTPSPGAATRPNAGYSAHPANTQGTAAYHHHNNKFMFGADVDARVLVAGRAIKVEHQPPTQPNPAYYGGAVGGGSKQIVALDPGLATRSQRKDTIQQAYEAFSMECDGPAMLPQHQVHNIFNHLVAPTTQYHRPSASACSDPFALDGLGDLLDDAESFMTGLSTGSGTVSHQSVPPPYGSEDHMGLLHGFDLPPMPPSPPCYGGAWSSLAPTASATATTHPMASRPIPTLTPPQPSPSHQSHQRQGPRPPMPPAPPRAMGSAATDAAQPLLLLPASSSPRAAPQPPPQHQALQQQQQQQQRQAVSGDRSQKFAAAVGAALAQSLPEDMAACSLAAVAQKGAAGGDVVAGKAAQFRTRLREVLSQCMSHMGFTPRKARAVSQGDLSGCSDVESRILQVLLLHLTTKDQLYQRMLTGGSTGTSSGGSGARGDVAASAAGGGASATGEADGLARLHVGGSGGGAGQQAAIYTGLALATDVDSKMLERYQHVLRTNACQIWALMHILAPHPDRAVKESLAVYTGRSVKQVTDWFTNWRARHWKRIIQAIGMAGEACGMEEDSL